jgi:hypothetical protein
MMIIGAGFIDLERWPCEARAKGQNSWEHCWLGINVRKRTENELATFEKTLIYLLCSGSGYLHASPGGNAVDKSTWARHKPYLVP